MQTLCQTLCGRVQRPHALRHDHDHRQQDEERKICKRKRWDIHFPAVTADDWCQQRQIRRSSFGRRTYAGGHDHAFPPTRTRGSMKAYSRSMTLLRSENISANTMTTPCTTA